MDVLKKLNATAQGYMNQSKPDPSPKVSPTAAKQVEAGVNWDMGKKMDFYKKNLKDGLGIK